MLSIQPPQPEFQSQLRASKSASNGIVPEAQMTDEAASASGILRRRSSASKDLLRTTPPNFPVSPSSLGPNGPSQAPNGSGTAPSTPVVGPLAELSPPPSPNFPKDRAKRHSRFQRRFNLPAGETLIDDFSCALVSKIMLHGRLYLSQHYLCFYSNVFGYQTQEVLPLQKVTLLEKRLVSLINPAILVQLEDDTQKKKYEFASFVSRDTTFNIIQYVLWNMDRTPLWQDKPADETSSMIDEDEDWVDNGMYDYEAEVEPEVEAEIDLGVPDTGPAEKFLSTNEEKGKEMVCEELVATSAVALFDTFFADESQFLSRYHLLRGDLDTSVGPWNSHPQFGMVREVSFRSPVKAPFGLKTIFATVHETHRYRVLPSGGIVIETVGVTAGLPYGDYFRVESRWSLTPSPEYVGVVTFSVSAAVEFIKNAGWLKGTIEEKACKESKDSYNVMVKLMKEWLADPSQAPSPTPVRATRSALVRPPSAMANLLPGRRSQSQPCTNAPLGVSVTSRALSDEDPGAGVMSRDEPRAADDDPPTAVSRDHDDDAASRDRDATVVITRRPAQSRDNHHPRHGVAPTAKTGRRPSADPTILAQLQSQSLRAAQPRSANPKAPSVADPKPSDSTASIVLRQTASGFNHVTGLVSSLSSPRLPPRGSVTWLLPLLGLLWLILGVALGPAKPPLAPPPNLTLTVTPTPTLVLEKEVVALRLRVEELERRLSWLSSELKIDAATASKAGSQKVGLVPGLGPPLAAVLKIDQGEPGHGQQAPREQGQGRAQDERRRQDAQVSLLGDKVDSILELLASHFNKTRKS